MAAGVTGVMSVTAVTGELRGDRGGSPVYHDKLDYHQLTGGCVCLGGGGASEASDTMIPMIVLVGVLLRHCYDLDCGRCLLSLDAAAASDLNCVSLRAAYCLCCALRTNVALHMLARPHLL